MRKIYFFLSILLLPRVVLYAQIPSLYNTHTLAESVVNPYVGVFDDNACRVFASNFLVPNLYANAYLRSDILPKYNWNPYIKDNATLQWKMFDSKNNLRAHADMNWDILTVKWLVNKTYQSELMVNYGIRGAGGGKVHSNFLTAISDTMNILKLQSLDNEILRLKANGYLTKCLEFGWRSDDILFEDMNVGVKVSYYDGISAVSSKLRLSAFEQQTDSSIHVKYKGNLFISDAPENAAQMILPQFKNIGLAVAFGFEHVLWDEVKYSVCIKDLGFISFANSTYNIQNFEDSVLIQKTGMYNSDRRRVWNEILARSTTRSKFYVLPTRIEVGAGYTPFEALNARVLVSYIPSYQMAQANVMGDFHWDRFHGIVNVGYGNDRMLQAGLSFLMRTTRWEAFLGCENIYNTIGAVKLGIEQDYSDLQAGEGFSLNLGFAYKLGSCNTSSTRNDALKFKSGGRGGGISCPKF